MTHLIHISNEFKTMTTMSTITSRHNGTTITATSSGVVNSETGGTVPLGLGLTDENASCLPTA